MSTGFYGKIPSAGDFVTWNLPRVFVERWDRWMSMELRDRPEQDALNPRVWRFAVSSGIFCPEPCAGAWRMSEDRVGRRYPLAVVLIGSCPDGADPWYDGVADLLSSAIEEEWPVARLQERLAGLGTPSGEGAADRIAFWTDEPEATALAFADIFDLADNGLPAMRTGASVPGVLACGS